MRIKSIIVAIFCLILVGACTEDSTGGSNNGGEPDAIVDTNTGDDTAESDTAQNDTGGESDVADTGGTEDASDDSTTPDDTGANDTTDDSGSNDSGMDDTGTDDSGNPDAGNGLYVGSGDPYGEGNLSVSRTQVAAQNGDSPLPLEIWAPDAAGTYAVVLFQHGFQLENGYYSTILSHLASHGFIVIAPQLGGGFGGGSTAAEDAGKVKNTLDWLEANLAGEVSVTPSFDHVGLSGHSRGSKVLWSLMTEDSSYGDALVGVDPVDGTGGPFGGEERVIDGDFAFNPPVFILGTGLGPQAQLGQACAPDGDNHVQFYGASQSPAWHVVATNYGHMDMLDANNGCTFVCNACPAGSDLDKMRELTAGMLTAFFRGSLQGVNSDYSTLLDTGNAPASITAESK